MGQVFLQEIKNEHLSLDDLYDRRREQIARERFAVYVDENRVLYKSSHYITGINTYSGSRWWRWKTIRTLSLSRNPNTGRYIGKTGNAQRTGYAFYTNTPEVLRLAQPAAYFRNAGIEAWSEHIKKTFGEVPTLKSVFPMLDHYQITETLMPVGLGPAMMQSNAQDFTTVLFGKSRYRKDLVKAVADANPAVIAYAWAFRGLVPIDWIIEFMRMEEHRAGAGFNTISTHPIRPLLKTLDPRSYRTLLKGNLRHRDVYGLEEVYRRSLNRWPDAGGVRLRTWGELSTHFEYARPAIVMPDPKPIKPNKLIAVLDGQQAGDLTVVMPKDTDTVVEWGKIMHNCIGGYAWDMASDPKLVLGAIEQDGKVIANFEIRGRMLKQLLGSCNAHLPLETLRPVCDLLEAFGVVCDGFWGEPEPTPAELWGRQPVPALLDW